VRPPMRRRAHTQRGVERAATTRSRSHRRGGDNTVADMEKSVQVQRGGAARMAAGEEPKCAQPLTR
jgi:hypothetical protein